MNNLKLCFGEGLVTSAEYEAMNKTGMTFNIKNVCALTKRKLEDFHIDDPLVFDCQDLRVEKLI